MRRRLLFGLALACSVLWAPPSGGLEPGDPSTDQPRSAPPRVRVMVVGTEPAGSFRQRLESWFTGETQVTVASAPSLRADQILGADQPDIVDVWVDLRAPQMVHVYLVVSGKEAGRWLVRDLALEQGMDELGQERLAQVLFSSALAVWEGRAQSTRSEVELRLGTSEPSAAVPSRTGAETPPSPPPSSEAAPGLPVEKGHGSQPASAEYWARLGYGISTRGPEGLAHGPELWALLLERRSRTLLGGFLMAGALMPFQAHQEDFTLELTGARAKVGVSVGRIVNEVLRMEAGAGIGADVIHYEPKTGPPELVLQPGETEVRPVAGAFLAGSIPAGPVRIVLAATVDVQLARTTYIVRETRNELLKPWQVQPGLAVWFAFGNERR